jgi:phosphatidylglycerol---prolipoprotein diacylglyceryl transferase
MWADFAIRSLVIPYPKFDPIALKLGPIWIRWYGLSYVVGLLLGWFYVRRLVANRRLWAGGKAPLTLEQADMLLLWIMAGVVLGGRLLNIVLYDPVPYLKDPMEILRTWHGGMSFHGGLLGVLIAILLFAWRHGLAPLPIGDVVCTVVPLGLFFGRIANFINGELWGRVSDVPWAMVFPDPDAGPQPRHPSQLYEAGLEGLLLGVVLYALASYCGALKRKGAMTGAFLIGYAITRSFSELFREGDSTWFFQSQYLTAGMLYCIPMVFVGWWLLARSRAAA